MCCKFIIGLVEWIEITAAVLERIYESSGCARRLTVTALKHSNFTEIAQRHVVGKRLFESFYVWSPAYRCKHFVSGTFFTLFTQCIVPIFLFFSLLFSVKLYRSNPGTLQGLLDFNLIKSKDLILFHACALFLPRGRFGLIMTYSFSWSV